MAFCPFLLAAAQGGSANGQIRPQSRPQTIVEKRRPARHDADISTVASLAPVA
jgi:hypothetical protein